MKQIGKTSQSHMVNSDFRTLESLVELGGLTLLSFLKLSYNKLVGEIPNGHQFKTFSIDSFKENQGLCGFPLNINCSNTDDDDLSPVQHDDEHSKKEIGLEYVSAELGHVVGFGSILWLLLFCLSFKDRYFDKIDEAVEEIFVERRGKYAARRQ